MDVATDERDRMRLQELIRSIGADLSLLMRQQVALAKEEVRGIAAEKATGGALLAAAAVFALFVLGFVSLAGAVSLVAFSGSAAHAASPARTAVLGPAPYRGRIAA